MSQIAQRVERQNDASSQAAHDAGNRRSARFHTDDKAELTIAAAVGYIQVSA
jgi:hypothetical protein